MSCPTLFDSALLRRFQQLPQRYRDLYGIRQAGAENQQERTETEKTDTEKTDTEKTDTQKELQMTQKIRALAIDGPAGAGKSTIARAVSRELGWIYVDTGAMFRALALFLMRSAVDAGDEAAVSGAVRDAVVSLRHENGEQQIFLNGENVSAEIRTEAVGNMASAVSVYPAVRSQLLELQRGIAASQPVVMDGRDIGTNVLPNADVKIFLTASVEERARRRYDEMKEKGYAVDFDELKHEIASRDKQDSERAISPLRQAEDAVLLDSTSLTIDEVVARILKLSE